MLTVIFAASLLTTLVSIVHVVTLIGLRGSIERLTVQAETTTALLVPNVGVLATSMYRHPHKGESDGALDDMYSSTHTNMLHTAAQTSLSSTEMFGYDKSTGGTVNV
ncbi:hypothetical protein B0H14DRAFT_2568644 [Mycena olivaceomarginata]|nr:hypothetical protein B0H14DRAFT_2568644 [Mycena olivaceomarginata]